MGMFIRVRVCIAFISQNHVMIHQQWHRLADQRLSALHNPEMIDCTAAATHLTDVRIVVQAHVAADRRHVWVL